MEAIRRGIAVVWDRLWIMKTFKRGESLMSAEDEFIPFYPYIAKGRSIESMD